MKKILYLLLVGLFFSSCIPFQSNISSNERHSDFDVRGTWVVTENNGPSAYYSSTWLIGSDGDKIFGASEWDCCPGYRVDQITGTIEGNKMQIIRHVENQGNPSGTQLYIGYITGDKVIGTWSGLGGDGNWEALIIKKANQAE